MGYEPIGYIFEYELGALAVFLVIMLRYYSARLFPNQKNRLYTLILWSTVADVLLDVLGAITIDNVFSLPLALTYIVNTAFYSISVIMLVLMMVYSMALVDYIDRARLRRMLPLLLPGAALFMLLLCNPFTRWFFYVDPVKGYTRGLLFPVSYLACMLYMVFTLILVLRSRSRLRRIEYSTILLFLALVSFSILIQYLYPALLVSGVAIMLAVVMMYFTLQNPEAMVDTTTGAFTYEAMLAFLHDRLQERDQVQLVAVKVQNMPRINELLGIENGSLLLRQLAGFLSEGVSDSWVFRMRGSCFVAVTRKKSDFNILRAQLKHRVELPWIVEGSEVLLQAIVCCVATDELMPGPISPEEAVNYLEKAFEKNQHASGRIVYVSAGADILDAIKRERAVESALREALASGQGLELYFQPLWSVRQERYVSAEVLLRFRHPRMGFIPPDEFVYIAEKNGLITALDEFVVRKTCELIREHDHFRPLGLETLDINLSALEFMQRRLPELLSDIMAQYQVDPALLCFEVTETAATESFELLRECMVDIRRFGCQFALDDFGTGYANISQVIRLPFSVVKLDKSLLNGPAAVLEDLVRMFARMNQKTVIEGVETAECAQLVRSYGVDIIQGYYYALPMCESDFIRFLQGKSAAKSLVY